MDSIEYVVRCIPIALVTSSCNWHNNRNQVRTRNNKGASNIGDTDSPFIKEIRLFWDGGLMTIFDQASWFGDTDIFGTVLKE